MRRGETQSTSRDRRASRRWIDRRAPQSRRAPVDRLALSPLAQIRSPFHRESSIDSLQKMLCCQKDKQMKAKTCRGSSWTCQLVRCGTGFTRGAGEKKILKPIRCILVASKSSLLTILSIIGLFFSDEILGRSLRKWIGGSDTALSKAFKHKHKRPWTSRQKSGTEVNDFPQSLVYDCQEYLKQQVNNKKK